MSNPSPEEVLRQRVVRVFVSSTFRDMHAERDELVKRVFPQLRKLCEERGVTWTDVDLRWGITDEQSAEGEVLPICLAEIQRCRPYFIGLLGQRYGWVPQAIDPQLVREQPWLAEHRDKSVTELEILHGVLNDPAMANRTCFYFRDPAYVERIPAEQRADFVESDPDLREKLAALKDRIRRSGLALRENYGDPETLGRWVLHDLTTAINQAFPPESKPDALARDVAEHEAFARSRTGVYIGRRAYFERLDAHAAGDGPPLVVLGESGSGKSALLANWLARYRNAHRDAHTIVHFIGASAYSTDWAGMLRRIMGELQARFGFAQEIPDQPDALRLAFANCLSMAAARGRVVLILDALNQLEDRDGAADLVWLPPQIPANIRLVVSTLPGRALDDLTRRGWPVLRLEALDVQERSRLIDAYLAQYTKQLSRPRAQRIASRPQAANPLYLRALLEELRVFGEHERLDAAIDHYLAADSVPALYEKILDRYEHDYQRDRPKLVRDAMTLLWAARRGLSEPELLELLGTDAEPLPRAHWSPLYLAAEQALVSRSGLIGFFHDYLRQAVEHRYLPGEAARDEAHLRLADYFDARDLTTRKVDELPWQLAEGRGWKRLAALLAEPSFLEAAWAADPLAVRASWARVEGHSSLRMVDTYSPVLKRPAEWPPEFVWRVATLFQHMGKPSEALVLWRHVVEECRSLARYSLTLREAETMALGNQAMALWERGEVDSALGLLKEQERLCRAQGDKNGLARCLGNQAMVVKDRGDLDGAMALHKEEERLYRGLGDRDGIARSLGDQGLILHDHGDLDGAMALFREHERLCRELGNKDGLAISLGRQGDVLRFRGDFDEALKLYKEEERVCRELGDKAGLAASLGSQATVSWTRGDLDGALALHKEEERLCREIESKAGLCASWGDQALILRDRGDLRGAEELLKAQEKLCRNLADKGRLQACLTNLAGIAIMRGDLASAMLLLEESECLCRELGKKDGLIRSLGNQAVVVKQRGDLNRAFRLLKEVELLCRELDDRAALQACLGNQAEILAEAGDLYGALQLFREVEGLCRQTDDMESLVRTLANEAVLLGLHMGRLRLAAALAEDAHKLAVSCGYAALVEQIKELRGAIGVRLG